MRYLIFLFLMILQVWAYAAATPDSTKVIPPNVNGAVRPILINYGTVYVFVVTGSPAVPVAGTANSCPPGYQLQYKVSVVNTELNNSQVPASMGVINLNTCLNPTNQTIYAKQAWVAGGGRGITVDYTFICWPCPTTGCVNYSNWC